VLPAQLAPVALLLLAGAPQALAQTDGIPDDFARRWQVVPPPAPSPTTPPAERPAVSIEQALYLIRSTLLTLNDANRSGNYTVLRDLAAPEFQARHSAADLSLIFSDLRQRRFDLYGAALLAPQLTAPPALDAEKRLRLAGIFPTRPLLIAFDLKFQVIANHWRLIDITITTPQAPDAQAKAPGKRQGAERKSP